MESALNPREIQTRIRSGASIEQVAAECGVPATQVEPFATPVLAERAHQALNALQSPVRRRGETGSSRTLRTVVTESLQAQGIDADSVDWDAWRTDDRLWIVVGRYPTPGVHAAFASGATHPDGTDAAGDTDIDAVQEPQWRFDPRARYSTAVNDQARTLIGEAGAIPARRRPGFRGDFEPTVDLTDERALLRASQDAAEMTIPLPASSRPRDEDAAHGTHPAPSPLDYDDLASRQDDTSPAGGPREVRPQPNPVEVDLDVSAHVTQPQTPQQPAPDRDAPEALDEQPRAHYLQPEQPLAAPASAPAEAGAPSPDEPADTYVDTELEQVDGVYDFVPSDTASLDSLYEMLQGFNEDSVNIYEGLDTLPPVVSRGRIGGAGDDASEAPGRGGDGHVADDAMAHEDAAPVDRTPGSAHGWGGTVAIEGVDFGAPTTAAPTTEPAAAEQVGHPDASAATMNDAGMSDAGMSDADTVATGWPASMDSEREPETTLQNPVDHDANDAARAAHEASSPASATDTPPADVSTAANTPQQPDAGQTDPGHTDSGQPASDPATADHEETRAITPRPKRRKRAAVPSWDEIMFGGPGRTDI